jgi:hypothetical protein
MRQDRIRRYCAPPQGVGQDPHGSPFSVVEFDSALSQMKIKSAPGADRIPVQMILKLAPDLKNEAGS